MRGAILAANPMYGPFGETLRSTGLRAAKCNWKFSTKYTDQESGWVYYGIRYYSPLIEKWVSRDPIGEDGGLSIYCLCRNDAVDWTDPLGMVTLVERIEAHAKPGFPFYFYSSVFDYSDEKCDGEINIINLATMRGTIKMDYAGSTLPPLYYDPTNEEGAVGDDPSPKDHFEAIQRGRAWPEELHYRGVLPPKNTFGPVHPQQIRFLDMASHEPGQQHDFYTAVVCWSCGKEGRYRGKWTIRVLGITYCGGGYSEPGDSGKWERRTKNELSATDLGKLRSTIEKEVQALFAGRRQEVDIIFKDDLAIKDARKQASP